MALKNDKVSSNNSYIPDDVSFVILSKLPLKYVKRFTCTCKSWSLLFENPFFIKIFCKRFMFMHQSLYNDTSLFLKIKAIDQRGSNLYLLSGEEHRTKVVKLEWPFSSRQYYFYHRMLDSGINDILCFSDCKHVVVKLWNPATKELVSVPSSPAQDLRIHNVCFNLHGYGYDHVNDDYKIIRRVYVLTKKAKAHVDRTYLPKTPNPFWEIYSVRNNSWKRIDLVDMPKSRGRKVYLNGLCHWWADADRDDTYMVSFNLSNEVFFTTHLPFDMQDSYPGEWVKRQSDRHEWVNKCFDLVVLNGFLAMIAKHIKTASFHIYVLGELGVRESWTKLFILGSLPSVERLIGVGKKGDLFFIKNDKELASFDLNAQTIEDLGVKGEPYCCVLAIYKKNILPIGRKRN